MLTRINDWGLGRWGDLGGDLEASFRALDGLRREMDRWATDFDRQFGGVAGGRSLSRVGPRMSLYDAGSELKLRVELPGFQDDDVQLSIDGGTITISGERQVGTPEGYTVHRRERGDLTFSRSATLPTKVDPEKSTALLEHGILEVTLPKAPEAQPKQIAVKVG